ncbi:MAG TPA: alpha/beta hydrolase-fold protein [Anaeromyxobacteraceae bacterium]|nr:alpha/beta hydrolase-fold protein [Anaeromyxobacteraceae bacterium]
MTISSLALAALLAAPAPPASAPPVAPGPTPAPFGSLAELDAAMAAVERGGDADAFWERVKSAGRMPLVFDDTAVFLHRSRADRVEWRGDFTGWRHLPEAAGRRLGESDVWTFRRSFVRAARLDYKIVEVSDTWIVDPLNPHQQLGGYGPNSEVRMPDWKPPPHLERKAGVAAGTFGPPEAVPSAKLGYAVNVRIWRPARQGTDPLPVLYVTDGSDWWHEQMGGLTVTLDNLVAEGRLPPLLAVFVDPWDPDHKANRREAEFLPNRADQSKPIEACPFCEFLVQELSPLVEARFRVDPKRRGILGTSLGGFNAAFMGLRYPERFPLLAIQSPALQRQAWLAAAIARAAVQPRRVAIDVGGYEERFVPPTRSLRAAYRSRGVPVRYREVPDGHSWGHWRATVAEMLEFLYGAP